MHACALLLQELGPLADSADSDVRLATAAVSSSLSGADEREREVKRRRVEAAEAEAAQQAAVLAAVAAGEVADLNDEEIAIELEEEDGEG